MRHRIPPPASAPTPPTVAPDLDAAARAFFPDLTRVEPVTGGGLVRVEAPTGTWCVRRWPAAAPRERVDFVHAVLRHARAAGIDAVPTVAELPAPGEGSTLLLGGRRYDAQSWLPGRPAGRSPAQSAPTGERINLPAALPETVFTELVQTVAKVHAATVDLPRRDGPVATLESVDGAVQRAWGSYRTQLRPVAATTPVVQRWLRTGERALPAARAALIATPALWQEAPVAAHLDLWPAHALAIRGGAGGERLSGLVDWERTAFASPLLDLSQLVTNFAGWSAEAAEAVLAAYREVHPLAPETRRLLPAVAALDLVAETGWLLGAAYAPRPAEREPLPETVRVGVEALVASLEAVVAVLERGDRSAKDAARRWDHRRPKPGGASARPGPRPSAPNRGAAGARSDDRRPARPKGPRRPKPGAQRR